MKNLKQFIKDILPVIFGILIALLINTWNEERKKKDYLEKIYTSIENELKESREDISSSLPKQELLIQNLQKNINNDTISIYEIINMSEGINAGTLKNYSWKAISSSNIELVDFEKISILAEIDESKRLMDIKLNKGIDFLFENIKSTDADKKEILILILSDFLSNQQYVLKEIDAFLELE